MFMMNAFEVSRRSFVKRLKTIASRHVFEQRIANFSLHFLFKALFFFTHLRNNNIVVILVDSKSFHFKLTTILRQLNIYESKVHSLFNQPFSRLA